MNLRPRGKSLSTQFHGWTAEKPKSRSCSSKNPYAFDIPELEDEFHNPKSVLVPGTHRKSTRWITEVAMATSSFDVAVNFSEIYSQISRCWTRRSLPPWRRSSQICTSERGSIQKSRKLKKMTDSFAEDRLRSRSTNTSRSLVLMKLFMIALIYSEYLYMAMMFRNFMPGAPRFHCQSIRYFWTIFWKACISCACVSLIHTNKILNNIIPNRATRN